MDLETVRYSADDGIARITLDRPERHNAINGALLRDLALALDAAEEDDGVRCVVLAGAGKSFCSGWDTGGSPYITPPEAEGRWTKRNSLRTLRTIEAAGAMQSKEALNTALDILGVGALFRYHGQMNALGRLDP